MTVIASIQISRTTLFPRPPALAAEIVDGIAVGIDDIDGVGSPSTALSWQCSSSLDYQDIDYLYAAGIGGQIIAAREMQPVEDDTQQAIIAYVNQNILTSVGPAGLRPLVQGVLTTIEDNKNQAKPQDPGLVISQYLQTALGAILGVYAATLADVATFLANSGEVTGSRSVLVETIIPITSIGVNKTHTKTYIIGLWLLALFAPVFIAWMMLFAVTFVTPLYPSDFTDPVAVMLQSVSDVPGAFEGMSLGDPGAVSTATASTAKLYFKATAFGATPRRAYFALDPPNNGEALISGNHYN